MLTVNLGEKRELNRLRFRKPFSLIWVFLVTNKNAHASVP